MATFTLAEVGQHCTAGDMWIVIDGDVYDISRFAALHPGGEGVLQPYAGKDATEIFFELHKLEVLARYPRLKKGRLASALASRPAVETQLAPGRISEVPYAEVGFWQGQPSPYFNESHRKFRVDYRRIIDEHLIPLIPDLERTGACPSDESFQHLGRSGILLSRLGPGPWMEASYLKKLGITLPGGLDPADFDAFHEMIAHQEMSRTASPSVNDGIGGGYVISIPVVMQFGRGEVRERVGAACLRGDKRICLAVTEPFVGSDVAQLRTTAARSECGNFYIVNGCKKWITAGMDADFFVTAVRTGGAGASGISCLLVERTEGLTTRRIETAYGSSAGTSYVMYDNVKVPVGNLLGQENRGFQCKWPDAASGCTIMIHGCVGVGGLLIPTT